MIYQLPECHKWILDLQGVSWIVKDKVFIVAEQDEVQVFIHTWIEGGQKIFVPMHLILKPPHCVRDDKLGSAL